MENNLAKICWKLCLICPFYLVKLHCLIGYVLIRQGQKLLGILSFHFLCVEVKKQSLIEESTISETEIATSKGILMQKAFLKFIKQKKN